jgi:carboxyl-terminal processing protease
MRTPRLLAPAAILVLATTLQAQQSSTISLQERVTMATQIYHIVSLFFPGLSQQSFDASYQHYLAVALHTEDRREFDLASMALVAELHDGHSWFTDRWLDRTFGQPIGFLAYPLAGRWTVVQSRLEKIRVGDVITAIDNVSTEDFFDSNRKYISASSSRDAGVSLFDTPVVFPERFTVTLGDGRRVPIERQNDQKLPAPPQNTEGRWLTGKAIAYIKVPIFHGVETQARAFQYLREFKDAKTIILDVRGNPGGGEPLALQLSLMGRPYQAWTESSSEHGGPILRNYANAYPEHATVTYSDAVVRPRESAYAGRLILLTDRICSCACEDFVMPFKYAKRATLVGETTAGTFSLTRHVDYENGMVLNISAVHHTFPDGSTFEGVGITPDVRVDMTPDDLKVGRDPVLQRALEIAQQP